MSGDGAAGAAGGGFDVGKFVESFPVIVEAEGGVQRLRQMVLGLALHGKLLASTSDGEASGGLPAGWRWESVGKIADCVLGKMLDKSKHTKGKKRPYLRNINVRWNTCDLSDLSEMYFEDDELKRYGVQPGDVLVCEGGEPGRSAVWTSTESMLIQKAIHRVRPSAAVLPVWIVLNLRYDTWTDRLSAYFTGATIKHFTGKALDGYSIRLPPIDEQKRIVAMVDELMRLIDDLEAKQKRKREVQARWRSAALDKLKSAEGLNEFNEALTPLTSHLGSVFDAADAIDEFRDAIHELAIQARLTGSGPADVDGLPSTWRWATPDDVRSADRHSLAIGPFGSSLLKSDYTDSGVPLIFVRDITSRAFGGPRTRYVGDTKAAELSAHVVRPGDLLITKMGTPPGDTAIYPIDRPPAILTADCIKLTPNPAITSAEFLQVALRAPSVKVKIFEITMGVAHQKVSLKRFRVVRMPLPPLAEQKRIVAKVDQLMALCDALEAALRRKEHEAAKLAKAVVAELVA